MYYRLVYSNIRNLIKMMRYKNFVVIFLSVSLYFSNLIVPLSSQPTYFFLFPMRFASKAVFFPSLSHLSSCPQCAVRLSVAFENFTRYIHATSNPKSNRHVNSLFKYGNVKSYRISIHFIRTLLI